MTEYLYPTHPCGDNDKNWLESRVRDGWKQSCLPYFSFPFISKSSSELNSSTIPSGQPFWLYFYYAENSIKEICPSPKEKVKDFAKKLEYRARVVEYSDTQTEQNPFATEDVFVIPIDEVNGVTDVKFWFKCDRFEEVKVITTPNNERKCRLLTRSDDFEYAGKRNYDEKIGLPLRCISPFKLISSIVVTQTTWHQIEQT